MDVQVVFINRRTAIVLSIGFVFESDVNEYFAIPQADQNNNDDGAGSITRKMSAINIEDSQQISVSANK